MMKIIKKIRIYNIIVKALKILLIILLIDNIFKGS
jgi:hypothetical protein